MTDSNDSPSYVSLPQEATAADVPCASLPAGLECGMKSLTVYRYGTSLRTCSILGSARKSITVITCPDEIRLSAMYDA